MNSEKFKVLQFIREFIILTDNLMDNFPKKDIEIKNRIRMDLYEILELTYEANTIKNVEEKERLLYKAIAKIKVIDFLLNLCCDKKIITEKKFITFGLKLDDIVKYINGWINSLVEKN